MEALTNRIFEKHELIAKNETTYEAYRTEDADLIITAFGTVARVAKAAVKKARENGLKVGLFRPVTLVPFPDEALHNAAKSAKSVLDIEMNKGQMLVDVRSAVFGAAPVEFYGRPAGGLITLEDIYEQIEKRLG